MCEIKRRPWTVSVMDRKIFLVPGKVRHVVNAAFFIIFIIQLPLIECSCPPKFRIDRTETFCYILKKEPEQFSEQFNNCTGNLFTHEMYMMLNLPKPEGRTASLWTQYKSLYPGGIFVDWSFKRSMGRPLETSLEVYQDRGVSIADELCVVMDPIKNFTMVKCDTRHYRYCVLSSIPLRLLPTDFPRTTELPTITLKDITLTLVSEIEVLSLSTNRLLNVRNIKCFTDSDKYYPMIAKVEEGHSVREYRVFPVENGYYWCTHNDFDKFFTSDSNKALYIEGVETVMFVYAVKLKSANNYTLYERDLSASQDRWVDELEQYVYYSTKYSDSDVGSYYNNTVLNFRNNHPGLNYKDADRIIVSKKIKRLYLDAQTVLLHVELDPDMKPARPGQWDSIYIEYMKPVYFCDVDTDFILGMNQTAPECKLNICDGNFNEGVEITTVPQEGCSVRSNYTTPEKSLEEVTNKMRQLINSTDRIGVNDWYDVFHQVDYVLDSKALPIPSNFLQLLDKVAMRIDIKGSKDSFKVQKNNFVLLAADAQPHLPVMGLRITGGDNATLINATASIIRDNATRQPIANDDVVVLLPPSVSSSKRRVSFVVFQNNHAFQGQEGYSVNSRIVSINVENLASFPEGQRIKIALKPIKEKLNRNQNRTCAFWKFNKDNIGSWSQEGCNFTQATAAGQLDICTCNHLTHFAQVLVRTGFSEQIEATLEELSIVGCCVSIFGLLLVGITAALFLTWRREFTNKIWLQLCISILIMSVCFLIVVFAQFQESDILCLLTGVALHYSVLSSFCWMIVAAVISYRKLVLVFSRDASHKLLRASVFAWGAPCVVVGILLSVAPNSYSGQYEGKSPSGAFCYPSGLALWLAVYAPITLTLLANWTLFTLIMWSVFGGRRPPKHGGTKEAIRCLSVCCVLVFLFGLPWLFGLFAFNVVCAFLFTILVTFQGLVLFFFTVCNKKTRDLWLVKLKVKKAKNQVNNTTTMTDTNKGTGANTSQSNKEESRNPLLKKGTQPSLSKTRGT